jgi:copper resistance protein D
MMILLAWVHVLAAVAWIGGMMFLSLILVPVIRRGSFGADRRALFQTLARRFRITVWTSIVVLVATGPLLVSSKTGSLVEPEGWRSILTMKLWLVALLVLVSAAHDFWLGPLVGRLRREAPDTPGLGDQMLINFSSLVVRLGLVLALAVLFLAVALART